MWDRGLRDIELRAKRRVAIADERWRDCIQRSAELGREALGERLHDLPLHRWRAAQEAAERGAR